MTSGRGRCDDRPMDPVWPLVHAERAALVADLSSISEDDWERPSLCPGWSVRDVAAHLVDNAGTTIPGMVAAMVRARFDFDRMNDQGVAKHRGRTPADTLVGLRAAVTSTRTPPIARASRLVEEVVHGEDIRRPLGIVRAYPPDAVVPAIHYQLRTADAVGGSRTRAAGLRLVATDADLDVGEGRELRARAVDLLLGLCRRLPLEDLPPGGLT